MNPYAQRLVTDTAPALVSPRRAPVAPVAWSEQPASVDGQDRARPSWLTRAHTRSALLLLAPMLLMIFAPYFFAVTDPDYWWHVRTGQYIVETGTLPRADIYSYTVPDRPWVTHEWLTEVLLYAVQERYGYVANVALAGLVGALIALAVYAACRLRGLGEPAAAILMLWAVSIGMGSANVRPQILTTLLVAVCALLLTLYKCGRPRALWPLPALLALWVNLHGGYIIGLVLLGLTVIGEALARVLGRPAAPLRPLLLVTALSAAATLLSPHGIEAIRYPFSYAGSENPSMRFIAEWQSANFHQRDVLIFAGSLLLAILLGVGRRPLGPTEALWMLALALMALQSVRHIALYGVIATPLLGARLQAELPALRRPLSAWRRPALVAIIWPLVGLLLLRLILTAGGSEPVQLGREPAAATYPAGAVEYLRAHDLDGNLVNAYQWGGYLIYKLYPERPVFIDGRMDLYDEIIGPYLTVTTLQPNWRQVLADHDVRLVLVEKASPLAVVLGDEPGWREAYAGDVEQLFVRP